MHLPKWLHRLIFSGIVIITLMVAVIVVRVDLPSGPPSLKTLAGIANIVWFGAFALIISAIQLFFDSPLLRSTPSPTPLSTSPANPNNPVPPGFPVPLNPMPTFGPQKRYIGSGIALWLSALCMFFATTSFMKIVSGTPTTFGFDITQVPSLAQSAYLFAILADICLFCSLSGLQEKQALRTGLLGMVAILAMRTFLLLDILLGIFFLLGPTPGQPSSLVFQSVLLTLKTTDNYVGTPSYILLGLSFLVGKIYPNKIGFITIALGCIGLFLAFSPPNTPISIILTVLYCCAFMAQCAVCGWILIKDIF